MAKKSLAKPTGSNQPMSGAGGATKSTGRAKLRTNIGKSMGVSSVPSNPTRGMKGNMGTKTGS